MSEDRERIVTIDENRLDEEVIEHAKKVIQHGDLEAEYRHRHAQAKAKLDLTLAELKHKIRKSPLDYELEGRTSNDMIEEAAVRQEEYQKQLRILNTRKYELDLASSAVNALEHRKRMIEDRIRLIELDWHADVNVKGSPETRERIRSMKNNSVVRPMVRPARS